MIIKQMKRERWQLGSEKNSIGDKRKKQKENIGERERNKRVIGFMIMEQSDWRFHIAFSFLTNNLKWFKLGEHWDFLCLITLSKFSFSSLTHKTF